MRAISISLISCSKSFRILNIKLWSNCLKRTLVYSGKYRRIKIGLGTRSNHKIISFRNLSRNDLSKNCPSCLFSSWRSHCSSCSANWCRHGWCFQEWSSHPVRLRAWMSSIWRERWCLKMQRTINSKFIGKCSRIITRKQVCKVRKNWRSRSIWIWQKETSLLLSTSWSKSYGHWCL